LRQFRKPITRLQIEGMESRFLLSVIINEFPVSTTAAGPNEITAGPDGNLWFTEAFGSGAVSIGQINPTTQAIALFPVSTTAAIAPGGITAGPDGNLWFTEAAGAQFGGNAIGQINPTTHAIAQFPTFTANVGHVPGGITAGPDGNLWFTEKDTGEIAQINPTSHAIAAFPIPSGDFLVGGIVSGPDGNLWFTEAGKIGRINPTTHAESDFPIPSGDASIKIAVGPDGNLWFTEGSTTNSNNGVGDINPTTDVISEFPTTAGSAPEGITAGSDGNLWFTESQSSSIGEINPTTHAITEFSVPSLNSLPSDITAGPDGNLWFTEVDANNIGQVVLHPADLALAGDAPASVVLGQNVTYTLTVTNDGTGTATGVTLTDSPPAGVTFVSATGGIQPVNGLLTFPLGSLAAGASTTVTVVVTPKTASTIPLTDFARVLMKQTDPTLADNSITLRTVVSPSAAPDLAISGDAPGSVALGNNVTYTLTVTNDGSSGATGVKLIDTLPAGVSFVSATGGVAPANGALTFDLGNLAAGANLTVAIVVTPEAAITLKNQASVGGNETDATPADNSLTQTTKVSASGPVVTGVQRFGFHAHPTTLVLTFNTRLDPARAERPGNYEIVALDGPRHAIPVERAVYDAALHTVTLSPVHRLNLHRRYRLTVIGTGPNAVTDTFGDPLNDPTPGDAGSNFITTLTARNLVLTTRDPAILRAYRRLLARAGSPEQRPVTPPR
jgi:virginiamycin B lyase